jgi:Zn-dependent peptidase ImmA (M78 family)
MNFFDYNELVSKVTEFGIIQTAEYYGVTTTTIYYHLRKSGNPIKSISINNVTRFKDIIEYIEQFGVKKTADKYGVTQNTIRYILKHYHENFFKELNANNKQVQNRGWFKKINNFENKMKSAHQQQIPTEALAKHWNVSSTAVHYQAKKLGLYPWIQTYKYCS